MSEALRRPGIRERKSHMRRQSSTDNIRGSVRAAARKWRQADENLASGSTNQHQCLPLQSPAPGVLLQV